MSPTPPSASSRVSGVRGAAAIRLAAVIAQPRLATMAIPPLPSAATHTEIAARGVRLVQRRRVTSHGMETITVTA